MKKTYTEDKRFTLDASASCRRRCQDTSARSRAVIDLTGRTLANARNFDLIARANNNGSAHALSVGYKSWIASASTGLLKMVGACVSILCPAGIGMEMNRRKAQKKLDVQQGFARYM